MTSATPLRLDHFLERTVLIRAPRATVFRYFTDSTRFAAWWGQGSTIDARPGGAVRIVYPTNVLASGEVVEVKPPERIVFTYGYEDPAKPFPPGGSRVTIDLEEHAKGTLLHFRHDLPTAASRDEHVQGWRYQLALFANVVGRETSEGLAARVDTFLAAWSEPDAARRRAALGEVARPDLTFSDAFSCTSSLDDLVTHLAAAQMHMPGLRLEREGDVRHCQGVALADWVARGPDGAPRGKGTNVFELAADGRITRVVGFWAPPPR
jgi:uncharacterized protein YndB with AHSA1/START domain